MAKTKTSQLAEAKALVQTLKSWLPSSVEASKLGPRSKLPYKAMSLREPLLYRIVELGDVTCRLYEDNMLASAFTLTRSTLETSAMLYWLHMKMEETVKAKEVGKDLDNLLNRALLGRKDRDVSLSPINVQTCINHVDKRFKVIKEMYDDLSEYAHPNWFGVMSLYGRPDKKARRLNLQWPELKTQTGEGLPLLCAALILFKFYYEQISVVLPKFIEVCNQGATR